MTENNDLHNDQNEEVNVTEEYVEGYWICPNCSAKCRGSEQGCSNCGAIRGENVEFFCDDDAPAITDETELEKAKSGPDWICQFCGNTSPAASPKCTGCGSYREDGKKRKVTEEKIGPAEPAEAKESKEPPKPLPMGCKIGCSIFAVLLLILMAFSCQQKPGQLEVLSASWQRTIEREQYKTVPIYKDVTKTRRVKRQKYRKEPVFDTKITYDVEKWTKIDKVTASGVNDEPRWPETNAAKSSPARVGDIREGARTETFKVKAKRVSDGDEYEFDKIGDKPLTFDQFMKLRKGSKWEAIFSGLGALREIKFDAAKK